MKTPVLKLGVIKQVQTAEFGATLVGPVAEPNGAVRNCGDFNVTVNTYADIQQFPLPHPKELRAALAGRKSFPRWTSPTDICKWRSTKNPGNAWSSLRTRGFFGILVFHSGFMVLPQFFRAPLTRFYKVLMELSHTLTTSWSPEPQSKCILTVSALFSISSHGLAFDSSARSASSAYRVSPT